ncbi:hypothetical protein H6G97_28820 [Nostoc flagelliforme FACHB-838]|uniref:Uncharacterized protein n=1 Tax=Nostoc flagelliforme FACHB-838 TaxID=2692904 RepID=A0ABR8DVA9_9NOSO|nr:hypothetical protein [Nostoc flagelliforme]MBD2533349.1 hypothetical protein [Nostoc flagelliforme FACHB-838]
MKNQPKNPLRLNDKNLGLFHSGGSSKPHAIRYNLSHSGETCCKLRDSAGAPAVGDRKDSRYKVH